MHGMEVRRVPVPSMHAVLPATRRRACHGRHGEMRSCLCLSPNASLPLPASVLCVAAAADQAISASGQADAPKWKVEHFRRHNPSEDPIVTAIKHNETFPSSTCKSCLPLLSFHSSSAVLLCACATTSQLRPSAQESTYSKTPTAIYKQTTLPHNTTTNHAPHILLLPALGHFPRVRPILLPSLRSPQHQRHRLMHPTPRLAMRSRDPPQRR